MKDIVLSVSEFAAKAKAARGDVPDLASLRKIEVPENGTPFMVQKVVYIFMADDRTSDDDRSSIRPESVPASKPGRYRRATIHLHPIASP